MLAVSLNVDMDDGQLYVLFSHSIFYSFHLNLILIGHIDPKVMLYGLMFKIKMYKYNNKSAMT